MTSEEELVWRTEYEKYRHIAKENGVCARTYRYRIGKGYTFEDAATFPRYKHNHNQTNPKLRLRESNDVVTHRTKEKVWIE